MSEVAKGIVQADLIKSGITLGIVIAGLLLYGIGKFIYDVWIKK